MQKSSIVALDVGRRRIGVAIADTVARIAHPLTTLAHDEEVVDTIATLAAEHNAHSLVVGLPRGLSGQHTEQSAYTEEFVKKLQQRMAIPMHVQDEAVTSHLAEQELKKRGKPYSKEDVDALAATYILEDYLNRPPAT